MFIATQRLVPHRQSSKRIDLPVRVSQLYARELEIASIVYSKGLATAVEVGAALEDVLDNSAVRSMLNRLVKKGILNRVKGRANTPYLYTPAISALTARETELKQFAEDFFGGAVDQLVAALADAVARERQRGHAAVKAAARR